MASALGTRYQHLHDPADVDEALSLIRSVLTDPASGAGVTATRHADCSDLLRLRANREHDQDSGTLAVTYATRASELLPAGSAQATRVWSTLGSAHAALHELSGELHDAHEAIKAWLHSGLATGPHPARLYSLYSAGMLAFKIGSYDAAADALATAVNLLPHLAWAGLTRGSQEDALRQFQIVASSAAAARLQQHEPVLAVEALERGRHILWSTQLNLQADNAALAEHAPELAEALTTCAQRLASVRHDLTPL